MLFGQLQGFLRNDEGLCGLPQATMKDCGKGQCISQAVRVPELARQSQSTLTRLFGLFRVAKEPEHPRSI